MNNKDNKLIANNSAAGEYHVPLIPVTIPDTPAGGGESSDAAEEAGAAAVGVEAGARGVAGSEEEEGAVGGPRAARRSPQN